MVAAIRGSPRLRAVAPADTVSRYITNDIIPDSGASIETGRRLRAPNPLVVAAGKLVERMTHDRQQCGK
jgi:hypothetical protein